MEAGIAGVLLALKIVREHYAQEDKSDEAMEGAGGTIVGFLEFHHSPDSCFKLSVRHPFFKALDSCHSKRHPAIFYQLPSAAGKDRLAQLKRVLLRPLGFLSTDFSMHSSFGPRACSPSPCAPAAECLQDAWRVGHPPCALPHGIAILRLLAVLAPVAHHDLRQRQLRYL